MKKLLLLVLLSGLSIDVFGAARGGAGGGAGAAREVPDAGILMKTFMPPRDDRACGIALGTQGRDVISEDSERVKKSCAALIGVYGRNRVLFGPANDDHSPNADFLREVLCDPAGVGELIAQGANFMSRDYIGKTALHRAAECGHLAGVTALLSALSAVKRVAVINVLDAGGATALHSAAQQGELAVAEALIYALPAVERAAFINAQTKG